MKNTIKILTIILIITLSYDANARGAFGFFQVWNITQSYNNCKDGLGVCYVMLSKEDPYQGDDLYINVKTLKGYFTVNKKDKNLESYLNNNKFVLKDDSPLNPEAQKEFKIDGDYQISKGVYEYDELESQLKIYVNFKKIK